MNKSDPTSALVVLSGGQDSATCLAIAMRRHANVHAISFDYGQRHVRELACAAAVASLCGVQTFEVVKLGAVLESASPLVSSGADLEQYRNFKEMDAIIGNRVEKTFVPMRNALFLTIAANRAIARGAARIYTGVCEADNANYPDCRLTFIDAQQRAINEALGLFPIVHDQYLHIDTPLIHYSKAESIHVLADRLDALWLLAFTHTAYDGQYPPTGHDHATVLRAEGFVQARMPDPLIVRAVEEQRMELPLTPNYDGVWEWHGEAMTELRKRINIAKDALHGMVKDSVGSWPQLELVREHLAIQRDLSLEVGDHQ